MIEKKSIKETTGTKTNVAQSFYQNIFYLTKDGVTVPSVFEVPQYTTVGGTKDYYMQDPRSIFTNLVQPFIRFDFSANTASFGPTVKLQHDVYRVTWDLYNTVQIGLKTYSNEAVQTKDVITETIEEFDEATGETKKKTITRTLNKESNIVKSERNTPKESEGRKENLVVLPTVADIQAQLDTPIFSMTAETTGITTSIYDLQIDQFTKNLGQYKTELFKDRDQYIIDTNFIFEINITNGLKDYQIIDYDTETVTGATYENPMTAVTESSGATIDKGAFAGLNFKTGDYFSFFEVPDKPTLEYPTPEGQIETFTPEILWTNGEAADEYMVQVNYNTGDTGFTGTVFTYIVPKIDKYKEVATSKTKDTTSEFSTDKTIRKYQLSLKTNKCLLYRVGNVKVLNNLFDVRQSVVTFSDNKTICTQAEPMNTFVKTENDSPWTSEIAGLGAPPSLEAESPLAEYNLSGTVSGSTVSGATMQLIYPNASFVTTPTDAIGYFEFNDLEEGSYTLNTTYRGYAVDSRQIALNANMNISVEIQIQWDNIYDLVATKENDIIKY
jgi:hypothetical protein